MNGVSGIGRMTRRAFENGETRARKISSDTLTAHFTRKMVTGTRSGGEKPAIFECRNLSGETFLRFGSAGESLR
jgi:hypothetical protein